MTKVYVGDAGTLLVLDCGQNISAATVRSIEARKPNGAMVSWPATANGANSLQVILDDTMFTSPGRWFLQAKVTLPAGVWRGETVALDVYTPFS